MKELTAGQITEMAIEELDLRGFDMWVSKQASKKGRRFRGRLGASDLTGYHRTTGVRCECECKTIGDYLSDDQKTFLEAIRMANGHALVAYDNGNGGIYISSMAEYNLKRIK